MEHLGADAYVVSSDKAAMKEATDTFDYILDTVPAVHRLETYISLLKAQGKLLIVGATPKPLEFLPSHIILGNFLSYFLLVYSINLGISFLDIGFDEQPC